MDFVLIDDLEEAWKADIIAGLKPALGLVTVDTFESNYDNKKLQAMMALSPFVLINYAGAEREGAESGGAAVYKGDSYHLFIGAQSLASRRTAQKGCYTILDELRKRYDGQALSIPDPAAVVVPRWQREFIVASEGGLIVYQQEYTIHQ